MKNIAKNMSNRLMAAVVCVLAICIITPRASAQWESARDKRMLEKLEQTFGEPKGMVRLDPQSRVWADKKNKRVITDGYIALREGQLEMLACLVGTKEHESVVAVFTKAFFVHAGLLAVGAKKGTPVQWRPEYAPPTGSEIRVVALWRDEDGKRHAIDTRKWVREIGGEDKELETNFVFAGSIMYKDPETGEESYEAEQGDLICVANFSTATLDVPLRSLSASSLLTFVAFTDRIPPSGTPIRLVLEVVSDDNKPSSPQAVAKPKATVASPTDDGDIKTVEGEAIEKANPSFSLTGYERLLDAPEKPETEPTEADDAPAPEGLTIPRKDPAQAESK